MQSEFSNQVKDVLSMPGGQGIEVLSYIIKSCGMHIAMPESVENLNFNNGRRSIGAEILQLVKKENKTAYIELLKRL